MNMTKWVFKQFRVVDYRADIQSRAFRCTCPNSVTKFLAVYCSMSSLAVNFFLVTTSSFGSLQQSCPFVSRLLACLEIHIVSILTSAQRDCGQ